MEIVFTSDIRVNLVQQMGGDDMIAAAAWVSTNGQEALEKLERDGPEKLPGLINFLMKHRHGTPFEHAALTFFCRAPLFVWREWHRHRIGFSYNEESARYKQLEPEFWIPKRSRNLVPEPDFKPAKPKFVEATDSEYGWFVNSLRENSRECYIRYQEAIDRGFAKECARAHLPVNIYSSCWVTCNPRSLMAFLSLRTHDPEAMFVSHPQAEIEEAARVAEIFLQEGWPLTYAAFVANGRVGP